MVEGEPLPDRKFIVFTNPSDNASPYGDALGRTLYWPIWFKKHGVKFEAVFLDKFGQPTPWGKYPPGTAKDKQDDLLDALKAMQTDQALITPDNMAVELLEATRTSSVACYESWRKFWNDAITFIILGQTATTEGTPGKLGEETARADIRKEIVKADADLLCECQNTTLIPWLVDYNFPGVTAYPKVWIRTEPEQDLKPLAERDRILIKEIGVPTPVSYIRDTYGIPEPEEGEEMISVPQTPAFQPPAFSERNHAAGWSAAQENIDDLVSDAIKQKGLQEFYDSLVEIVDKAQSLADLEKSVLEKFGDLKVEKLRDVLSTAFLMAYVQGVGTVTSPQSPP
jgi:phage gp29-like protein